VIEESWHLVGRYYNNSSDWQYHIRIDYGRANGYTWAVYKPGRNSDGGTLISCGERAYDDVSVCAHEARAWVVKNLLKDEELSKQKVDTKNWLPLHWGK
jgi:hypothetical protein